jgi:hypothetical protein
MSSTSETGTSAFAERRAVVFGADRMSSRGQAWQ